MRRISKDVVVVVVATEAHIDVQRERREVMNEIAPLFCVISDHGVPVDEAIKIRSTEDEARSGSRQADKTFFTRMRRTRGWKSRQKK